MFYQDESVGPCRLSLAREPQPLGVFTNRIPDWNKSFGVPAPIITSAEANKLGQVAGFRVMEVRLSLTNSYYTGELMILREMPSVDGGTGEFLPAYVQVYNHEVRYPTPSVLSMEKGTFFVIAGMRYYGSGGFQDFYKITLPPEREPVITDLSNGRQISP